MHWQKRHTISGVQKPDLVVGRHDKENEDRGIVPTIVSHKRRRR